MKNPILAMALFAAACGTDDSVGVAGQEAELHCRAWCTASSCGGGGTGPHSAEVCLNDCRLALARLPCGAHPFAYQECMMALNCNDEFRDCQHHSDELWHCESDRRAACSECATDSGDSHQCNAYSGECGHDPDTAKCEFRVRAAQFPSVAACMDR